MVHDEVDRATGLPGGGGGPGLHELGAPAGIDEVVEAHAGKWYSSSRANMLGISPKLWRLMVKRRPTLMPAAWQLRIPSRRGKRPGLGPKAVIHGGGAVQADADVGQADLLKVHRQVPADQGAVGGNDRPHALGDRLGHEFQQVLPHQRFPSRKQDHRRPVGLQVQEQVWAA